MRILIADDEKEARELIVHYLNQMQLLFDIHESEDGITTLGALSTIKPDILFLDIKMPNVNGIEILRQQETSPLPAIIFTTAYDQYALPAFNYDAVDYLLKPFNQERFNKAVNKAKFYVQSVKNNVKAEYITNLPVKSGSKTLLIPVSEIEYLQAEAAYVRVVSLHMSHLISQALYELEAALNPGEFLRIHRSVIVNIHCIQEINSLLNGDYILKLKSGKTIRASRTYRDKMKKILNR